MRLSYDFLSGVCRSICIGGIESLMGFVDNECIGVFVSVTVISVP